MSATASDVAVLRLRHRMRDLRAERDELVTELADVVDLAAELARALDAQVDLRYGVRDDLARVRHITAEALGRARERGLLG